MSDIHLGIRNDKIEEKFERTFYEVVKKISTGKFSSEEKVECDEITLENEVINSDINIDNIVISDDCDSNIDINGDNTGDDNNAKDSGNSSDSSSSNSSNRSSRSDDGYLYSNDACLDEEVAANNTCNNSCNNNNNDANCSNSEVNLHNLILIPGDLFNYPIVKSSIMSFFARTVKEFSHNTKFIISAGNHDSSPINETATLNVLEDLCSDNTHTNIVFSNKIIDVIEYRSFDEMSNITVASLKNKRIIISDSKILIDAVPYYNNKEEFVFNKTERAIIETPYSEFNKILMCHGILEYDAKNSSTPIEMFDENEIINRSYYKDKDAVIKGHIHKVYSTSIQRLGKKILIYSTGSLNKTKIDAEGVYSELGNELMSKLSNELSDELYDSSDFNSEHKVMSFKFHIIPDNLTIKYKIFDNENKDTINKTLLSLGSDDIVSIRYVGNVNEVNSEEYMRCFNECLKFSFIFSDIDMKVDNYLINTEKGSTSDRFIGFYPYMDEVMKKISNDSESDILLKIYNENKNTLTRKEN